MLEIEIQTTEPVPEHLAWKNRLKTDAAILAGRLQGVRGDYAKRIENCSDLIKLIKFGNGFVRFKSDRKCRVRGCPICEYVRQRKRQGRIAAGIRVVKQQLANYNFTYLTLPVDIFSVSELKAQLSYVSRATQRLTQLKDFRAKGWARFLNVSMLGDQVILSVTLLMVFNPSAFTRYYVSRSKWQTLWEQSLRRSAPKIEWKNLEQNTRSILRFTKGLGSVDLSLIEDSHLPDFISGISKAKFFVVSGILTDLMADRPKSKRKYHPSELVALKAVEEKFYAYLPNPDAEDYGDEYLRLDEFHDGLFADDEEE